MHQKILALFLLISTWGMRGGTAQDLKSEPPPTPPFLAAVPKNADWTVILKYPATAVPTDSSDPQMMEVHSTKVDKLKRDSVRYVNGPVKEMWFYEMLLFWKDARGDVSVSELNPETPRFAEDPNPVGAPGYPGVGWVNLSNYKGAVLFEKIPSYHYSNGTIEAWIDMKSKLPLAYRSGGVLYQYRFDPDPPTSLTMPPDFKEAWDKVQSIFNARKQYIKDMERR